ncbi:MAG: sensor histidine kinase [Rhizomicrobium sp.]
MTNSEVTCSRMAGAGAGHGGRRSCPSMNFVARLRFNSLAFRLIAAAAVWTLFALVAGGLILSNAFRTSVQNDFDSELRSELDSLVAAAGYDRNGAIQLDQHYLSSRFQRAYSGDYWQIEPVGKKDETMISHSLLDHSLVFADSQTARDGFVFGHGEGPDGQYLRILARRIEFPIAATAKPDDSRAYMFTVAADMKEMNDRIATFNGTLTWSFVILGLGLVAAVFLQVRIGLQPLRRVTLALHRIRDGSARRLDGRFPSEIEPLASELNSLIEHSAEVVGRARSYVSNLAHFLKTPLTVLTSEAEAQPGPPGRCRQPPGPDHAPPGRSLSRPRPRRRRPRRAGQPHLRRAGARRSGPHAQAHPSRPQHRDRSCLSARAVVSRRAAGSGGDGRQSDRQRLQMGVIPRAGLGAVRRAQFTLLVEDDGPGLTPEEREQVGERGERLDESVPGTGLGLAIVRDIAKLYGGSLDLGASDLAVCRQN